MNAIAFSRTCCHAKLVNKAVPHLGKRAIMHGNYSAKYSNTCPQWLVTPSIEPIIHEQFKTIFFCFPGLLFFSHSRISTHADIFVFFFTENCRIPGTSDHFIYMCRNKMYIMLSRQFCSLTSKKNSLVKERKRCWWQKYISAHAACNSNKVRLGIYI